MGREKQVGNSLHQLAIGLWCGSIILDLAFFASDEAGFAMASYLCIGIGILAALLSIPPALRAYLRNPASNRAKRSEARKLLFMYAAVILFALDFFTRYGITGHTPRSVPLPLFVVSLVGLAFVIASLLRSADSPNRSESRDSELTRRSA
jgi:uncharacterized membrane protein